MAIASRPYAIAEFRAMGSPCRIVSDKQSFVDDGVALVHALEARWSRFLRSSEITELNRARALCIVSPDTFRLIDLAEFARAATGGWFNPLVLDQLEAIGYGEQGPGDTSSRRPAHPGPARSTPIELFPKVNGVRLPEGTRFDPGGIGKGLAGDLVVEHLVARGARTIQVELGGDVRLAGENWVGGPWRVRVQDSRDRHTVLGELQIDEGAAATSSVAGIVWQHAGRPVHHLIDPSTGLPSTTDLIAVTATASQLWWAEVVAKVALMSGSGAARDVLRTFDAGGLILDCDGGIELIDNTADRDERASK